MSEEESIECVPANELSVAVDEDGDVVIMMSRPPEPGEDVRETRMAYNISPLQAIKIASGLLDSAIAANEMQATGKGPVNVIKRLMLRMGNGNEEGKPASEEVTPREPDGRGNPWDKPN